jgi:hypothetical protein
MRLLAGAGLAGSCRRPRSLWPGCWHPVPFALAPHTSLPAPGSPHGPLCRDDGCATARRLAQWGRPLRQCPGPGGHSGPYPGQWRTLPRPATCGACPALPALATPGPHASPPFPSILMAIDFALRLPLALARTVASRRNLPIRFAYGARVQQDGVRALELNLRLLARASLAGSSARPRSPWPGCWHPVVFALAHYDMLAGTRLTARHTLRRRPVRHCPALAAAGTTRTPLLRTTGTLWCISGAVAYPAPAGSVAPGRFRTVA